ncbi:putative aminophospholipid-translocase [Orbilia oligospora]|uniref:Phospholipid-transporting ATPase n=1 Tax=Orbilia oligospora TaxID=2813651 RepID=A0A7C8NGX2_ORBOL|nr:putative aminophospholipid-translocase [Orbilia oligospora]KAF3092429.1 putative aminophospholipid-translocase [Orbilia oligospora]KAF3105958.1 putative aminophospholipid-translocase [Orbilia oligospora]KAF3136828.1 putative aminophospholipid-translocase [Orbilia oligospora]
MSSRLLPPDSPASYTDDSDDDFPLEELDPTSHRFNPSTSASHEHSYRLPRQSQEARRSAERQHSPSFTSRIGLMTLRRKLGGSRFDPKDDEEDLEALIADRRKSLEPGKQSDESLRAEDVDTPLLRPESSSSRSRLAAFSAPTSGQRTTKTKNSASTDLNRTVDLSSPSSAYPPNVISNAKYTPVTFLPLTLYNEFKYFFNLYFLLVALSQIIPKLRIGYISTYIVPLAFVLMVTLGKEAYDDIARRRRDAEANSEEVECMVFTDILAANKKGKKKARRGSLGNSHSIAIDGDDSGIVSSIVTKKSRDLKVGDILHLRKDQRVPADVVLLKTVPDMSHSGLDALVDDDGPSGEAFIRTDQLDGETDWKLRLASPLTQGLYATQLQNITITAAPPSKAVNTFVGTIEFTDPNDPHSLKSLPLSIDHTAWANTVLASSTPTLAAVVYTGTQTRQALSTSKSRSKTGLLEIEINTLTKILCALTLTISILLVVLHYTSPKDSTNSEKHKKLNNMPWYIAILRFLILFSTIIPISLRVNLDMGKSVYAWFIERDKGIEGTVVRTSTIPEELGRVEYLLTDKTGTLTQNDMELKKVHVGTVSYAGEAMDEVAGYIRNAFLEQQHNTPVDPFTDPTESASLQNAQSRSRREIGSRVRDVVVALALAHNVTPTTDDSTGETSYQAASPDEIAIVKWCEGVGLKLVQRDRKSIQLAGETGKVVVRVKILDIFPFTSEGKRMGVVVRFLNPEDTFENPNGDIWFFQKGADTIMARIVASNDWLEEECGNMAREGLRTLVVGRKKLSIQQYEDFASKYKAASLNLSSNRDAEMGKVVSEILEQELELLGVTGVEDRLQLDVKPSLELLRNAGIKIWMLTGDKVETARCVGVSAKLVARGQFIYTIEKLKQKDSAYDSLEFLKSKPDSALIIDGESLSLFLDHYKDQFISIATRLPAVIACRCSPTQKADIATLIRTYTKKRICCIGDGGNDVSMIQAADVGVGIVGKEGRQASLAADFSILQFKNLVKLLLWHGRCSYKRSAKLAQFVMHRGLVISVCQTLFSIASRFEPIALYQGYLLVGYATIYTMFPVFSLVLDRDIDESLANLYPELYKELTSGQSLSYKTFFIWVLVSVYQGSIIQGISQLLVHFNSTDTEEILQAKFLRMVTISFTALVLNELIMVALEITTWCVWMIVAEVGTLVIFFASWPLIKDLLDLESVKSIWYWIEVSAIVAVAIGPVAVGRALRGWWRPESYQKVQAV